MPIRERDGDVVTAHIVRIGQDLTLTQHNTGSDTPPLPDADHRIADPLGHALDLFLDSIKCCHCLAPSVVTSNLQVTTLSLCVNALQIRFVYERTGIHGARGCTVPPGRRPHSCWGPVDPARGAGLTCRPSTV